MKMKGGQIQKKKKVFLFTRKIDGLETGNGRQVVAPRPRNLLVSQPSILEFLS